MQPFKDLLAIKAAVAATALFLLATPLSAAVEVAPYFGSHMVLQREQPVVVWGTADPGETVQVTLAGNKAVTKADNSGRWSLSVGPLATSFKPVEFRVNDQHFDNVVVGDVWLNSGQSNMSWALKKMQQAHQPKVARNPNLRLLRMEHLRNVAKNGYTSEELARSNVKDYFQGQWTSSTEETAAEFSAVAWTMGNKLTQEVNAPIGLVQVSVGGSAINNWLPPATIKVHPYTSHLYQKDWLTNDKVKEAHRQRARDAFQHILVAGEPYIPGEMPYRWTCEPGFLYEAGIEPLRHVSFKGVTWYQGEADSNRPLTISQYRDLLPLLIQSWRQHFQNPTLPFLAVQLPSFGSNSWPAMRESQRQGVAKVDHAALVVTIDTGHKNNIHPGDKSPIGKRLAIEALRTIYQRPNLPQYPSVSSIDFQANKLQITLGNYALGQPGTSVAGFQVSDESGQFFPATATFTAKDSIEVRSTVSQPKTLRYAWVPYCKEFVLKNKDGMPLPPQQIELGKDLPEK